METLPSSLLPVHRSVSVNPRNGRSAHHEYYTDWATIELRRLELEALGLTCLQMTEYAQESTAHIKPGHPDFKTTFPIIGYCCFRTPDDGTDLRIELAREGVHACGCPLVTPSN